jgi:NAD(P)-dependent dehydrogenase (short-subunit alcohol dehydrogenase family)
VDFDGKVTAVTGGGMGIGRAIALAFAQKGARLAILDIDGKAAEETCAQVRKAGCQCLVCETDVSQDQSVNAAVAKTMSEFGQIDILINNAGVSHPAVSILELEPEFFHKVMDVDLKGVWLCARRVGQEMVARGTGAVVNIASVAGLTSLPLPVYGPAKSAVIMLTQILARDWALRGVRVNAIAPGYVLTPLLQGMIDKGLRSADTILSAVPMKKFIMPEDIANAALFLCSDLARFITGATLPVDAGFLSSGGWAAYET